MAQDMMRKERGRAVSLEYVPSASEVKGQRGNRLDIHPAYYLFRSTDDGGFVLVSGEESLGGVLGYSAQGSVNVDDMPVALQSLLERHTANVEAYREGVVPAPEQADASKLNYHVVEPFLTSRWSQRSPYNNFCPEVGAKHCLVGCVATAMAQILYYYRSPIQPQGTVTWDTENYRIGELTVDMSQFTLDFDKMADVVTNSSSQETRDAVAQLSYLCGAASRMQYGTSSSGAFDEDGMLGLRTHFGFSASLLRVDYRDFYATQEEWEQVILDEIMEHRPVQMGGISADGSGGDGAGHSFLLDGIDNNAFVHVNWGWGGEFDAFYTISLLNPSNYQFSLDQTVILGIQPAEEGEKVRQDILYADSLYVKYTGMRDNLTRRSSFDMDLGCLFSSSIYPHTWQIGLGLFDRSGNLIGNVCVEQEADMTFDFEPEGGYHIDEVSCQLPVDIPEGDYTLRAITREKGYEEWVETSAVGGAAKNRYPVLVTENSIRLGQVSSDMVSARLNPEKSPVLHYDLQGRALDGRPHKGFSIQVTRRSDGTSETYKTFVK